MEDDALVAISGLPENPYWFSCFAALVDGESVSIPYRVYHNVSSIRSEKLNGLQKELIDCILTRHHDGFIRQERLGRIVGSRNAWIPAFVVHLLGEYVIEIIQVIHDNLGQLDAPLYAQFLHSNPDFLALTEQRVYSYWDCYYRSQRREEYVGFRVLRFFRELVKNTA